MSHHPLRSHALRRLACGALLLLVGAAPAAAVKRRAFVTSTMGPGDLWNPAWTGAAGGNALDRADAVCRFAAGALPNASTYRAWISTTTTDAYCHVQGLTGTVANGCDHAPRPLPGGGPWYLVNGVTNFTGSLDAMVSDARVLYRPVMDDEAGNEVPADFAARRVRTGTTRTGQAAGLYTCNDWTSSSPNDDGLYGDALGSDFRFTDYGVQGCDVSMRLLCLEPGASDVTGLAWTPGAIVFVTSQKGTGDLSTWPAAAGALSANAGYAICRSLAAAAHLPSPGSFVPWLSTDLVDAKDRLPPTLTGPFRRLDNFTVASSLSTLLTSMASSNSIHVQEDGQYLQDDQDDLVWTGTLADGTRDSQTCGSWTVGTAAAFGATGAAGLSRTAEWTLDNRYVCSRQQRLYCIATVVTDFWDDFERGSLGRWSARTP